MDRLSTLKTRGLQIKKFYEENVQVAPFRFSKIGIEIASDKTFATPAEVEHASEVLNGMAKKIKSRNLTRSQRQWAESVYDRLELEANRTLNLVSTGQVPTGHVPQFVWELNKPLKPPGR